MSVPSLAGQHRDTAKCSPRAAREDSFQRRRHREMLLISSAIVLLAFLLQTNGDERVALACLPNLPLPPTCLSYAWFGVRCPGCGLTRSLVLLAHGDWAASWRLHHLGFVFATAILLQFPYRIISLWREGLPPLGTVLPKVFGQLLIALLLANWLLELILGVVLAGAR